MTTAVQLDLDLLNELFDNQKLLDNGSTNSKTSIFDDDDLFNTPIIEEDPFLKDSLSFNDPSLGISGQNDSFDLADFQASQDLNFDFDDDMFESKNKNVLTIVVPVVMEIAVISCGIIYFS